MGTLTTKLTLTGSNLTSDILSMSLSKVLTVAGDVKLSRVATSATKANLLLAASFGKSYVYLKNLDASIVISIGMDTEADDTIDNNATDIFMTLGAGEFAFFPWDASTDIVADAAAGNPVLEVLLFEAS